MDLARVKYCLKHIDEHPESLTHCNGIDMAYFLPTDVRALVAEVERLTAEHEKPGYPYQTLKGELAAVRGQLAAAENGWSVASAACNRVTDERDKYKAALEQIIGTYDSDYGCDLEERRLARIAKDALK